MRKIYIIGILAAMSIFTFSSCNDVLDKAPLDLTTEDMVWSDAGMAQAYLNRICMRQVVMIIRTKRGSRCMQVL